MPDETKHSQLAPDEALAELITLSAALTQQLRSHQRPAEARHTTALLLGELSLLTTNLCRLQQQVLSQSSWLGQGNGLAACLDTTISSLRETFSFLQAELSNPGPGKDGAIHHSLQQLRDQRPALEFLLESASSSVLPPTPPSDSELESSWKDPKPSGSSLLAPSQAPTGLTPMVDTKAWIEPPPEYSPPGPNSMVTLRPEKGDTKASATPAPPEPSSTQDEDDDALYQAIKNNNASLASTLLSQGLNPNKSAGELRRTPLHQAAHLNHPTCISILLRKNANPRIEDSGGDTPLHLAAWAGHIEALSLLLTHSSGVDVDYLSGRDAYTPLWCAVSACNLSSARLLLAHGAAVTQRSTSGMTVLHQAAATGQSEMCSLLLKSGGADVDARDEEGQTALHYASAAGSLSTVRVLLSAGADSTAKQAIGLTPAHWAAHKGYAEVLALLIEHGGVKEVDARAEEGATALHLAANRGHVDSVRLLLEKGARSGLKAIWDGVEGTPTDTSRAKGHVRVAEVIEKWRR